MVRGGGRGFEVSNKEGGKVVGGVRKEGWGGGTDKGA